MANKRFTLEAVFKAIDQISAPISKMANKFGLFSRRVSRGFKKINRMADQFAKTVANAGVKAAKGLAAFTTALGVTVGLISKTEQENQLLAKSVGVNVKTIEALANGLKGTRFEMDSVVDLIEEMNNKLGESAGLKEITPVTEALTILGLRFSDIRKLKPEEQFKLITDAAIKMKDAQKAAAAVDILFGSEANKILGVLRQRGKSLADITDQYERMTFRTDASRKGALAFAKEMGKTRTMLGSLASEVSGLIGKELQPLLSMFNDLILANKDLIRLKVKEFIADLSNQVKTFKPEVTDLFKRIKNVSVSVEDFLKVMGWTIDILKIAIPLYIGLKVATIAYTVAVGAAKAASILYNVVLGVQEVLLKKNVVITNLSTAGLIAHTVGVKGATLALGLWNGVLKVGQAVMVAFNAVVSANPIGLLIIAIAALVGAGIWLFKNWDKVRLFFEIFWEKLTESFSSFGDFVLDWIDFVLSPLKKLWEFVKFVGGKVAGIFGDDNEIVVREENGQVQVVSPEERQAQMIEERRSTSAAEVTIKDETGKTEVTSGKLGNGITLLQTGAF